MSVYLQRLVLIPRRTARLKFDDLAEKSESGSVSNRHTLRFSALARAPLLLGLAAAGLGAAVSAAEIEVRVRDAKGQPVEQAVISVEPGSAMSCPD